MALGIELARQKVNKLEWLRHLLDTPTMRLAAIHLVIIMVLSISFSIIFYNVSTHRPARPMLQFDQSMPSRTENLNDGLAHQFDSEVRSAIDEYLKQTRHALFIRLIWLNIGALLVGAAVSYLLARWSLRPIEEAMDAQTQFVSDASHELRTPLAVLQTTNEVALRKKTLPAADARELIAYNVEAAKKLRDLSNTLLDLLKNTSEPVSLGPVSLQDAVSEAMTPIVAAAQKKNITIEDTVPPLNVRTNQPLLARVIAILLDNAVKYSADNSQVVVSARQSGQKVLLQVADQGIGIQPADLPLIFHRFYRADKSRSSTSDVQGYGLGLSIADKIAKRLGIKISVKSTPGKGSTFTVELYV